MRITSTNLIIFCTAAVLSKVSALNTGDLTVYGGVLTGGNCGLTDGSAKAKTHFAAIGAPRWDGAMNCGRCATARCTSDGCPNTPVTVMITDQCPECAKDDLDFSTAAYNEITGNMNPSRLTIEWDFVTCPEEYVSGSGKLFAKEGSSGWWFALQPQNFLEKVTEIKVNDIVLETPRDGPITSYYFVGEAAGITGEVTITVTSESGKVITQKSDGIPTAGTSFDMQGQFGSGPTSNVAQNAAEEAEEEPVPAQDVVEEASEEEPVPEEESAEEESEIASESPENDTTSPNLVREKLTQIFQRLAQLAQESIGSIGNNIGDVKPAAAPRAVDDSEESADNVQKNDASRASTEGQESAEATVADVNNDSGTEEIVRKIEGPSPLGSGPSPNLGDTDSEEITSIEEEGMQEASEVAGEQSEEADTESKSAKLKEVFEGMAQLLKEFMESTDNNGSRKLRGNS